MVTDDTHDRRDNSSVHDAIEALREDVREDLGHLRDDVREDNERLEQRVMAAIHDVRTDAAGFALDHAKVHIQRQEDTDAEHATFREFIRNAELAQARRDGALGVFRFVLEQLSRHWRPLVALLSSVLFGLAILTGSVSIEVVAR